MRIWSVHPQYLDAKGLVALWREVLLARYVLEGKTRGYKNHPQLSRFRTAENPVSCINFYLSTVYDEALSRGYNFDLSKINRDNEPGKLTVTSGQVHYERAHLLKKLKMRDLKKYYELKSIEVFITNPLFKMIAGNIEDWEII